MRVSKEIMELKREIIKLRRETNQRLDIIEHELNKHVALNYTHAIVEYMSRNMKDFIKSLKCQETPQEEQKCKEEILATQQEYLQQLRKGNLSKARQALAELVDLTERMKQKMTEKGKKICAMCCSQQIEMLTLNKSLIDDLNLLSKHSHILDEESLELVSNIDPLKLKEKVLNPISHEVRLKIMLCIFRGNGRFTHFIETTGLNGGHLLYHLNKLKEQGFIHQYSSKDYGLTKKGMKTLLLLAQLNNET
jgi:hypothetical protein